jgi:hypothetical protein
MLARADLAFAVGTSGSTCSAAWRIGRSSCRRPSSIPMPWQSLRCRRVRSSPVSTHASLILDQSARSERQALEAVHQKIERLISTLDELAAGWRGTTLSASSRISSLGR